MSHGSGWEIALLIVVGVLCIIGALLGILVWGFSGFDKLAP
jgi:hypothetical protein